MHSGPRVYRIRARGEETVAFRVENNEKPADAECKVEDL